MQEEKIQSHEIKALDALNRSNIEKYLQNIRAMESLARIQDDIATLQKHEAINRDSGEETMAAEVQGIRIGDCTGRIIGRSHDVVAENIMAHVVLILELADKVRIGTGKKVPEGESSLVDNIDNKSSPIKLKITTI